MARILLFGVGSLLKMKIMRTKIILQNLSRVWGIIVTSFLALLFGVLTLEKLFEEGPKHFITMSKTLFNWYDNPSGYVFAYFIGYAVIIWWKPLWGSVIIMLGSILFVSINGFDGPPIFAIPTFLVGLFYFLYWIVVRRARNHQ